MKTQKHAIHAATLFGAIIVFFCTVPAVADSYARIVRLSQVKGDVRIFRALPTDVQHPTESDASSNGANSASTDNDRAILNMPISQGMKLSTGTDGLTEIEFEDGAILRVAPESEVEFPELLLKTSGEKDTTIHLVEGVAYFNANPGRDNRFVLVAGGHEIPLTHSARFRAEVNNQEVKIAVFAGTVDTKEGDRRLGVRKGQEATIDITDNTATVAQSIEPGNFDDWDKQRSQYHDAYYKASAYQSYPYYGSGDLKYYGDWYSVSGYGSLWQPSNVTLGWNPFSSGSWTWTPGFGYMWASQSAWGWLPYHYGSWSFVPGWGWGWAPGSSWGAPLALALVASAPTGFVAPVPPKSFQRPVVRVGAQTAGSGHAGTSMPPPTLRAAVPTNASVKLQVKPTTPPVIAPPQRTVGPRPGVAPGMTVYPGNVNSAASTAASSSHGTSGGHH